MNLLQMSASGAAVIAAVILIRALGVHHLPKRSLLLLWGVALARLLLPFRLRTPLSAYNLLRAPAPAVRAAVAGGAAARAGGTFAAAGAAGRSAATLAAKAAVSPWTLAYLAGLAACLAYFGLNYIRCRREFRCSLPVESGFARDWLAAHPLRRGVRLRQSDRISAPLTYGLWRPVILMPKGTDWADARALGYVLAHEHVHIRRFDAALKLVLVAAACVHWFNPLVWAMYVLANRDIELSCDEAVVRRFGSGARADYAMTLISMEERRSGLADPLCSRFSKNAIEERIRAIMKFRKKSLLAALVAAALILGVAAAFATSAEDGVAGAQSMEAVLTREERAWLEALRYPGYEDARVTDYRGWALKSTDAPEDRAMLERLTQDEDLYALRDSDELAAFLHYELAPLTAERWQERDFGGAAQAEAGASEKAVLEYWGTLCILDGDALTVGEYSAARAAVADGIARCLEGMTAAELRDADFAEAAVRAEIDRIREAVGPEKLEIAVDIFYQSPSAGAADVYAGRFGDSAREWDALLSPYVPFGLKYEYNPDYSGNGLRMEFEGKVVRGIVDGDRWITERAGALYPEGAIELYAVREGGALVALRPATPEEERHWQEARGLAEAREEARERRYAPGDVEDYRALLRLMEPDCRGMRVAAFNAALLDCVDAMDYDSFQGILEDVGLGEFPLELTQEERRFLSLTFPLSNEENAQRVRGLQTGLPEEDPRCDGAGLSKPSEDGLAWCSLWYSFSYHVSDREALTVGERDDCVAGFIRDVEDFWAETSLDELLKLTEADVGARMRKMAEANSSPRLTILLDEEQVQFEGKDERSLAYDEGREAR